jgi:demethylmenaquinone methyltransferase/2-methoxy-6-polyprenyl-1,4-benzoquinol methylase
VLQEAPTTDRRQAPGARDRCRPSRLIGRLLYARDPDARGPGALEGRLPDGDVRRMFRRIAATYDIQNHLLSMWRDRHWRQVFVGLLRASPGGLLGDLAVGTGDVAIAACRRYPTLRVVGADFSPEMLRIARRKIAARGLSDRIQLVEADLRALPLQDASLETVTISFGIRNIEERTVVLRECFRVLKPGGKLLIMEMSVPRRGRTAAVYRWYFDHCLPLLGNILSRTDYAYDYLRLSIYGFPSVSRFLGEIASAGFTGTRAIPITFGTASIFRGRKPDGRGQEPQ